MIDPSSASDYVSGCPFPADRDLGGTVITEEGSAMLPYARDVAISCSRLDERASEMRGPTSGHLRIGTFSSVATHWLPAVIRRFQDDHPGMSYELLEGDYTELDRWVQEGRVDFAFTSIPTMSDAETLFLEDDELMAIVPKGHPLSELDRIPPERLCGLPFMLLERGGRAEIDRVFAEKGLVPDVRYTTWDDYSVMSMVEAGMGVSILPSLILRRIPYDICIRPLDPPSYRHIGVIMRRGARVSETVRTFLGYLKYRDDPSV